MNKIMSAINGLSDAHIIEFAYVKPKKQSMPLSAKIIFAAACLVLALTAIPIIHILGERISPNSYSTTPEAFPKVVVNGMFYWYSDVAIDYLPDGYELIGEVTSDSVGDWGKNGYSQGCKVGDKIYQNPDFPTEIIVYTSLFHGEKYCYIRFFSDVFSQPTKPICDEILP